MPQKLFQLVRTGEGFNFETNENFNKTITPEFNLQAGPLYLQVHAKTSAKNTVNMSLRLALPAGKSPAEFIQFN